MCQLTFCRSKFCLAESCPFIELWFQSFLQNLYHSVGWAAELRTHCQKDRTTLDQRSTSIPENCGNKGMLASGSTYIPECCPRWWTRTCGSEKSNHLEEMMHAWTSEAWGIHPQQCWENGWSGAWSMEAGLFDMRNERTRISFFQVLPWHIEKKMLALSGIILRSVQNQDFKEKHGYLAVWLLAWCPGKLGRCMREKR